ncbi:winged helix-turn-helix domain-containing protein [Shewanella sp. TB7-MNA-CIBAN-0143]|uniref:helix-turn-helix domain-containing protein n=1 Tax=Shewanella sp. TB7-MNA-CIBAN-0143 TaxID=3140465 RepID=UPI003326D353
MLSDTAKSKSGGRLTGLDIRIDILTDFVYLFHLNHIYKILHKLGFSWLSSRFKHLEQDDEVMVSFKTFQLSTTVDIPIHVSPTGIDIWIQDEAHIGQ